MTENLPAVVEDRALAPVSAVDTDSWIQVAGAVATLAERVANTEFVPKSLRNSVPAVTAAILYGREVGLPPMTSLTQTHVIEGKPAMSAEAMRALVFAAGHELITDETTGAVCTMRARRRGSEHWTPLTWTIDMARAAGVAGKQVWKSYPRQMLQARCTTELCRLVFPDVIHGFRSIEELDDGDQAEAAAPERAAPSTRVSRARKKAAPAAAPAPLEQRPERPEVAGPPLPGEDGYEPHEQTPAEEGTAETKGSAAPGEASDGVEAEEPGGEAAGEPAEPSGSEVDKHRAPRPMSRPQSRMLFARLKELNDDQDIPDEDRRDIATAILGRRVESFSTLTSDDAKTLLDTLGRVESREQLDAILAAAAGGAE